MTLGTDRTQLQLAAAGDHIIEYGIERQLVLAGPFGHNLPDLCPVAQEKTRCRGRTAMPRIVGENPAQIPIVEFRRIVGRLMRLLFLVMLGESLGEAVEWIDFDPPCEQRPLG